MASDKLGPTETNGNGNGKGLIEKNELDTELEQTLNQSKSDTEEVVEVVKQTEGLMDIPEKTIDAFGGDELRARVFYEKYALRDKSGRIVEQKPEDMWHRVAREMASPEKNKELKAQWEDNFYWLLSNFKFIPGGRILFGAGQQRRATLLNCYYMPIKEDSLEGIFEWCKEAARTYSFGGGVGTDISILRPKGAPVNNSAIYSTGAVSFMDLLSTTTGTIGQAGRRGALMITLDVKHPDIQEFIEIKNDAQRSKVQFANISIKISDEFMQAVEDDTDFELKFENEKVKISKTIRARDIWEKLVKSAWASAEPGLIFWDSVKKHSPTEYNGMEVHGVNPCSEQALEDYGNCCLGNINLSPFVKNAFTENASIDWENLEKAFQYSVRFLDNVLDYNMKKHPLSFQTKASTSSRRIGVGFTGFGDMLAKLNIKYDTTEGVEFADKMFEHIKNTVYEASTDLASEKGSFPVFDLDTHLSRPFLDTIDKRIVEKIKKQGLRNACILTVPPVGSGSLLAGTTSGVEPAFALSYYRRSKSLSKEEFKVYHPLVTEYREKFGLENDSELPDTFVTSHEIKPEMRVRMQAAIQKHIDSCISSTVNLPADITLEEVEKIYFLAWKLGCKGITVYREGSREGILVTEEEAKSQQQDKDEKKLPTQTQNEGMDKTHHPNPISSLRSSSTEKIKPIKRPQCLQGFTEVIKTGYGNLYVTVNTFETRPVEVFVQIGKSGYSTMADAEATGRLVSLALRSGIAVEDV
ncbi:MAG: adenosylcobalamin-dependent ribonucleoside-diphosphate reductase, partial [Thermodesulfobacteriota bacterium]